MIETFITSLKFARRELRSGLQGFWIFLTCLILGVGAIAIIGTLSASIERGLNEQGQPLLGGDIEFSTIHRKLSENELEYVTSLGQISQIATMRGIAISKSARGLVEVKAVDTLYPLYGKIELQNNVDFQSSLKKSGEHWGAFAEKAILTRLKIKPGDVVKLGAASFIVHQIITKEPDRIASGIALGPRLMITRAALKQTGLVKPGSLVRWHYRIKLADQNADIGAMIKSANKKFPDAGWRTRSRDRAAPGAERFIERLSFFLSLTGLTALVVGGAGVANAVSSFMRRHKKNIATLKCLGASSQLVMTTYMIEVFLVAALGIAIGLLVGVVLPMIALPMLKTMLPVPVSPAIEAAPLALAASFGFLVTLAFSLWPLAQAKDTPASELFRGQIQTTSKPPELIYIIIIAITIALAMGLALMAFPNYQITTSYLAGITLSFVALYGLARLIMWFAKNVLRPKRAVARLAVANIYRPGAPTPSIVIALGLGLTLFVTLGLVDGNVSRELNSAVPKQAPSFFFVDVQNTQLKKFKTFVDAQQGVIETESAPMLRGRIKTINDTPLSKVSIAPDISWAFRGDRGITYADEIPEGSTITKGRWWPKNYDGPPLVSFVHDIAAGAGLKIGDMITVNILGRNITAKIASFRSVEWESLRINFVMVFSPGTLKGAPHTHLVTVAMDEKFEDAMLTAVSDEFKAVTAVRIKDALDAVNSLLEKLLLAIRGASAITMITGILVLAGALASGLSSRTYDAVVLKTFGATRSQLIWAFVYEYALLGFITAAFSIMIGAAAAWAIVYFVMQMSWQFSFTTALLTALVAMFLTIGAGFATTWRALTAKPARILRTE